MDAMIFLLPIAIGLGAGFAALFLFAAARGQFDDVEGDERMPLDEG